VHHAKQIPVNAVHPVHPVQLHTTVSSKHVASLASPPPITHTGHSKNIYK